MIACGARPVGSAGWPSAFRVAVLARGVAGRTGTCVVYALLTVPGARGSGAGPDPLRYLIT